ncbi:hypothetical protein J2X31_000251 [Flavobacterium arsenatis]|uniref:Uncharacterized protein n=1 Tax=Flavobacterium arsenatis TaxID=1484332 RepID=A0ABU1TK70_9FLAO|nr:hypothetical protein [Flavobacterium arsenatis]MDR6966258.1 hypothetical protein [Flavobacterium arsenatis]
MKKIFIVALCLLVQCAFANELYSIKIEKNQKIQGTLSAELSGNATLHFVYTKNSDTRKFEILTVFVDSDKKTKQLDTFEADEIPSLLSYHRNGSTVTLANFYEKKKELQRIDFDVKTGKFQMAVTKDFKEPKNIFRLSNRTLFVDFDKTKNKLTTTSFSDSKEIKEDLFEFTKDEFNLFKSFFTETPEAVNQDEFVKNGSISKRKGYVSGDKLIFTSEKDKSNTQVLTLNLDGSKGYKFADFDFNYGKEIKDQNTFVSENKLLSVGVSKEDLVLNSFDMTTNKASKSVSLQKDLSKKFDSDTRQRFIESAAKSAMRPTVTFNRTKDSKFLVRLDRVNKTTYNYSHNWWHLHWMMHQQMIFQQQQIMMRQQQQMMRQSVPRGFGPNPSYYDALAMIGFEKSEIKPIEFVVDLDFTVDENASTETLYKSVDQDDYLEKYKDNKSLKEFTASFTNTDLRYIYFDKKAETVYLKLENL